MSNAAFLPYGRQSIDQDDVDAVVSVLRSDWLTQGPAVEQFEAALADRVAAKHVVAVSNGTAALHIGAIAAGLEPGRRLWTSPNTFVASANCGLYCGAEIDFVDIDPTDGNMDINLLAAKLAEAEGRGTLPDVVVPVHFAGQACDMERLGELRQEYGFTVLEDACHAIGGHDRTGSKVGACNGSDMAAFSFHPVKIVTTAEGGAVATNNDELAQKLRLARSHGITRDEDLAGETFDGPWAYRQIEIGFNYRLTDMQAALGVSQLKRLPEFVSRRNALAQRYNELLKGLPVRPLIVHSGALSAYHLYVVRIDESVAGINRRAVFEALAAQGIGCQVHYIPVHLQPVYRRLGFGPGDFPNTESYYREALSLPLFATMTEVEQDRVVDALSGIFAGIDR